MYHQRSFRNSTRRQLGVVTVGRGDNDEASCRSVERRARSWCWERPCQRRVRQSFRPPSPSLNRMCRGRQGLSTLTPGRTRRVVRRVVVVGVVTMMATSLPVPGAGAASGPPTVTLVPGHGLNSVAATSQLVATVTNTGRVACGSAKLSVSVAAGPDAPVSLPGTTDAHGKATFAVVNNGVPGTDTTTAVLSGVPGSLRPTRPRSTGRPRSTPAGPSASRC